ncbi:type IV secretion system protein [Spiractinospora alimapuensis]|nr:type IV secretion system protein [Spiractinospora alimapuensis]QVQ55085.1 type IV secretion system protein [Spiractinospora alimapuensis]
MGAAQAQPSIPGCEGEPAPMPQTADSGSDGLLVPPQSAASIAESPDGLPPDASLYGQYGTAGTQWHTIRDSCVDKLGSSAQATLASTAWDLSKTINQSTITVYQAATSDGLLDNFNPMVESVIVELREGLWRPLIPAIVVLGALWLGWYGLIRKRVTLTFESTIWMVLAVAMGMWVLVQPGQVLNLAGTAVNSGSQLVNAAVGQVSVPGVSSQCPAGAPEMERADWENESDFAVRQNTQMLWSGLVCRPWVAGTFGNGDYAEDAAASYGVELLEAQSISRIEQQQIADGELDQAELLTDKQEAYADIADDIETAYPGVFPLFSGDQAGERLGVATLALFASIFAGGLILAGAIALIVLKIGFLLLLLLAPVFLLIGIHPGFGRVILLRWVEMMFGLLLKQVFVILLISLLVMAYGMVMATGLSWGLQMILLSLFTLALFVYRKPFAHLFASVNANTFTSRMVNDAVTSSVLSRSASALPPVAYLRAQKWGLRRAPQLGAAAAGAAAATGAVTGGGGGEGEAGPQAAPGADTGANEPMGVRSDARRQRGQAGYGRARAGAAPPPLFSGQGARVTEMPAAGRSGKDAPRLSEAASVGYNGGGDSGQVPPRPAGGWTGRGSAGWSDLFGAPSGGAGGSAGRPGGGWSGGGGGDAPAPRDVPAPRGGSDGRAPRPEGGGWGRGGPRRYGGGGARWGGGAGRGAPRPAPRGEPRGSGGDRGGSGGGWFAGSESRRDPHTSSPFWARDGSRRDRPRRDVPFWLRDDDV